MQLRLSVQLVRKWIGVLLLFAYLFGQQSLPVFHKPPDHVTAGESLEITVSMFENIPVQETTLFYRITGQHSYRETHMIHTGLSWVGTIPGEFITEEGLEYAIILLLPNGGTIGFPTDDPFDSPTHVSVTPASDTGRRFPGSDQYAAENMLETDLLILSPERNASVLPNDIVIAASFFHAPYIDSSTVRVEIDKKDYSSETIVSDGIINLVLESLEPGSHQVTIYMKTVYGVTIKPVSWSFSVLKSGFNIMEQLVYSGDMNARMSSEYSGASALNLAETTLKLNGSITWMGAKTNLRLTTKETEYYQPYNRYSLELLFGDYLSIKMGDYFPSLNAFTISGKRIRGLGVHIRLPWLKFHSISGTINRAVNWGGEENEGYIFNPQNISTDTTGVFVFPLDRTGYTFKRDVNAYQLFVQPIKRFSLGLHFLKAVDDRSSVNHIIEDHATFTVDSLLEAGSYTYNSFRSAVSQFGGTVDFPESNWNGEDPQDNLVAGFEIKTLFDDEHLRFEFDWNLSVHNRNIWDGAMSLAELDTALDDSLDGLIGTNYDENGLIEPGSMLIDTTALVNPLEYEDIFTINPNMVPLFPIDIASFSDSPVAAIVNMPASAYSIRLVGDYGINNFTVEYHQVGPEFVSLGNPFLTSNIREFTMKNRMRLLDNKLILTAGYKHKDNKILKTTVDPLNTNTLLASLTLNPGGDAPTLMFDVQSIGKNNEKTELDLIGSERVDLRENSRSVNTTMSLNYPFPTPTATHNFVINFNTIKNSDVFEQDRLPGYLFPKTDTKSYAVNVNSKFPSSLRTVVSASITELYLPTFTTTGEITKKPYTWTAVSANGTYLLQRWDLRILGGLNLMHSNGDVHTNILGFRTGCDMTIIENLTLNLSSNLRVMNTQEFKDDGQDNDGDGDVDEFLESWDMNSYGILLTLGYRF